MEQANVPNEEETSKLQDEGDAKVIEKTLVPRTGSVVYAFVDRKEDEDLMPMPGGESSPEPLDEDWYYRLSSLEVPYKYKRFIKLACEERLPVNAVVGAQDPSWGFVCRSCGHVETTMHCLAECHHALAVWSTSSLSLPVLRLHPWYPWTFREFLREMTDVLLNDSDFTLFVLICWSLWEARNDHEEQGTARDAGDTLVYALELLGVINCWAMDKLAVMEEWGRHAELLYDAPRQWSPPPKGWLKMNVEALNCEPEGWLKMMVMGAVVRDDNGRAVAAVSARYEPEGCPKTALAIALKKALSWGENIAMFHHEKVVVELASGLIVKCLTDMENLHPELDDELCNQLEFCFSTAIRFRAMEFVEASEQENRLAYNLAYRALLEKPGESWVTFNAPAWLKEAINADLPD